MPSSPPSLLGASASTAGDDFHELWALQKVLQLLDPNSDLLSVVVEGVPDNERHAQIGEHGQAADVTEVRSRIDGEHVTYEQLKYSTAHGDTAWTWGRFFQRRSPNRPKTSVIGKLAGLFTTTSGSRTIRLVTNQPLSPSVATDFVNFVALLQGGPGERSEDLIRLSKETGLSDSVLADFLEAFDLGGFGSASRLRTQTALLKTLGELSDADARGDLTELQAKISGLIMPDNRTRPAVDRETLLAWLGAGSPELHFPAPSDLKRPTVWVEREVTRDLVAAMIEADNPVTRLSADGGCGKTSFMTMLQDYLPAGSETVLFDCYGGGLFLSSAGRRHLPQQAFVQVANELAGRLGSPFVLQPTGGPELTGRFLRRVQAAAALLAERSPESRLVLIFDAADNARIAADRFSERCFIDELTAIRGWPDNVRVILTCRPGRKSSLGPDGLFHDLVLEPFNIDETTRFVALEQPDWSPAVAAELHDLTGGVPRRLAYAVEDIGPDRPEDAIARLMPRATGMDPLFLHRVRETGLRIGDEEAVNRALCALAVLPRPMPSWALAETIGLQEGDIAGLANDLGGLVYTPQGWSFHDEDFEAFAGKYTEAHAPAILARACEILAAKQANEPYAARSLAEAYLAAGNNDALFDLAQSEPAQIGVTDEGERRALQMRRLVLSLRAARNASDSLQAQALLLTASKAVRVQRLMAQTITGNLDLSANLSTDEAFRQVVMGSKRRAARGQLRLLLAIAADEPVEARHHLRWWWAWAEESMTSDARDGGRIGVEHLVLEFEAHRRLGGLEEAVAQLSRWSPTEVPLQAADRLMAMALDDARADDIDQALQMGRWPRALYLSAAVQRLQRGLPVSVDLMRAALEQLLRRRPKRSGGPGRGVERSAGERALLILEAAIAFDALKPIALQALDRWWPLGVSASLPPGSWVLETGDLIARAVAVRDLLTGETTEPATLSPLPRSLTEVPPLKKGQTADEAHRQAVKTREAEERFNAARKSDLGDLAALLVTARRRVEDPGSATLDKVLEPPQRHDERMPGVARCDWALAHLHACDIVRRRHRGIEPVSSWIKKGVAPHDRLERLTHIREFTGVAAAFADDLVEIQSDLAAEVAPASSKIDVLMTCARTAKAFDPDLTRIFYNQALAVVGDVDLEAVEYLVAAAGACELPLEGAPHDLRTMVERLSATSEAVRSTLGEDVEDYMPWEAIITGCVVQDPATGLAVLGRWRDDAYVPLDKGLPALINDTALGRFPAPFQRALRLLAHAQELPEAPEPADVELYARQSVTHASARALRTIGGRLAVLPERLRDGRWARGLIEATAVLGTDLDPEWVREETAEPAGLPIQTEAALKARIDALPKRERLTSTELEQLAASLQSPGLRAPMLRQLAERFANSWAFLRFLSDILPTWRAYPSVRDWIEGALGAVISQGVRHTLGGSYRETYLLESLLALIDGADRKLEVMLRAVEVQGEDLAPEIMITLAGLIAKLAREDGRLPLVSALIDHTVASLGGAPVPAVRSAPDDLNEAFARWLFALMADADKRVRWRASHAARALLKSDGAFTAIFVDLLKRTDEPVFAKPDAFFYLQAARLHVAVVLQRVSIEAPAILIPFAAEIASAALAEPAHVLIRAFLKNAALELERAQPGTYEPSDVARLQALNRVRSQKASGKKTLARRQPRAQRAEPRYDFDDTDTTPYWFSPAAAPFQVDLATFETMAERWICDVWQAPMDAWKWPCDPRIERFRHADYSLTSHRHGSEPVLERIARYLDWHAMFCVIGELASSRPQITSQWSDTFEDWLADHYLTDPRAWVADLLGPPPAEAHHWLLGPGFQEDEPGWLKGAAKLTAEPGLRVSDPIVVAQVSDVSGADRSEHTRVFSALVAPDVASSLAAALETARDAMDFKLPDAEEDRFAVSEPGFEFEGWLTENQRDTRLDAADPLRRSVRGMPIMLPEDVQASLGLHYDPDARAWYDGSGVEAFRLEVWDRSPSDGAAMHGWRLRVTSGALAKILQSADRSLLVEVSVSRRMTGDYDPKRRRNTWQLLVIDKALSMSSVKASTRSGRYWVRRLGLEPGVNTLARWLVHRICELDERRSSSSEAERLILESEMARLVALLNRHL